MFKIGYTTGLAEANCDEGKSIINCVGDIVTKLAKQCCDTPKKMLSPSKIIEVTNGCFSSAQCVKVCDEFSCSDDSDSAQNKCCSGAKKTTSSCCGKKSPTSYDKGCKSSCNKNSCCGGSSCSGSTCSTNAKTGCKLSCTKVPSVVTDFEGSDLGTYYEQVAAAERKFKREYCDNNPYDACKTCQYHNETLDSNKQDIDLILRQVVDAIDVLASGDYGLATAMLQCPGKTAALLNGQIESQAGTVVGANLTGYLINLLASKGAMEAYSNLATAAEYTDFRREVLYSAEKLFQSGALVGLPDKYASAVSDILEEIGCSAQTITRITSRSTAARPSCYGTTYNLVGDQCTGKKVSDGLYESDGRPIASTDNQAKAAELLVQLGKYIKSADEIEDDPLNAQRVGDFIPYEMRETFLASFDELAQYSKHYFKKDPITGSLIDVSATAGTVLDILRAQYGELYEKEETGTTTVAAGFPDVDETKGATVYTGSRPCTLKNGLIVCVPKLLDAASYNMAVDTTSLITKTGVTAGEMAKIEGIGLSVYEIKMAYLLDHYRNNSVLPVDVEVEAYTSVLDGVSDD